MKKKHAYLKTAIWYREKIKDPQQEFAKAFDYGDIVYFRQMIQGLFKAALSQKVFRKKAPGTLLDDFERLEAIINAAYIFVMEDAKTAIDVSEGNLMNKNLYCGSFKNTSEWDDFPRHLTKEEYCDPYLVFKKFFKFQSIDQWKRDLKELLDNALVSVLDEPDIVDLLSVYHHLFKLVEAAHLIDVREVTHVDGHIKNRL